MSKEVWKEIRGFEKSYEISSWGRCRSLDRKVTNIRGVTRFLRGKILSPINRKGYTHYELNMGTPHIKKAHRLVAQAFIPNYQNKPLLRKKIKPIGD